MKTPSHQRPTRPDVGTGATRRRCWTGLAAAVLASGALTACGSSSSSSSSSTHKASGSTNAAFKSAGTTGPASGVTLRVGDQAGTGAEARLSAAGLLNKLPFRISWSDFTSGPPMLQAMSAGALDLGGVGDAPPVFAAAGGAKIAIVGAVTTNPNNAALVVPKGSPIHSISQLRGKRIAVAQGSSADYHLLTVLSKAGLTVHDVTLDYLQPAEGLAALSSGSVDAWDIWAPYIQEVTAKDGARVLVNGQGYGANYSYVVASRDAIDDASKAKEISEYLKVLNQAYRWADTHPQAWGDVWAKATGIAPSIMTTAAKDDTAEPVPVSQGVVPSEQSLVNAFSAAGLIPRKYNFANFAFSGFDQADGSS